MLHKTIIIFTYQKNNTITMIEFDGQSKKVLVNTKTLKIFNAMAPKKWNLVAKKKTNEIMKQRGKIC